MPKTILQIPLDNSLRLAALETAKKQGFSSLQEAVRVFLTKMASQKVSVIFSDDVWLSPKAIKRLNKINDDIDKNINLSPAFDSVDKMMEYLNSDNRTRKKLHQSLRQKNQELSEARQTRKSKNHSVSKKSPKPNSSQSPAVWIQG